MSAVSPKWGAQPSKRTMPRTSQSIHVGGAYCIGTRCQGAPHSTIPAQDTFQVIEPYFRSCVHLRGPIDVFSELSMFLSTDALDHPQIRDSATPTTTDVKLTYNSTFRYLLRILEVRRTPPTTSAHHGLPGSTNHILISQQIRCVQ